MIKVGLIGYGYWGPNLVRNFNGIPECKIKYVCDSREDRLKLLKQTYPFIDTVTDANLVIEDKEIDAVVIATPVFTHYKFAKAALENGKHVLLEKPMTASVKEAMDLMKMAEDQSKVLMVDHTFLYTGAVQTMKKIINRGEMGKIKYFDSTRINLGLFQPDVNVLWDLAPHDISILNFLVNETPYSVNATGVSHTNNNIENIAYLTVNYQSDFIAHFNCSWTSPVKIRMMLLGGNEKMLVYNDLEPSEKIRIYDTGYSYKSDEERKKILVDYRAGDVYIPKVEMKEALSSMANDFVNCIQSGSKPVADMKSGIDVVKVLEAAQLSIKQNGKEIKLDIWN